MLSKLVFDFKDKTFGIDEDDMIPVMAKIERITTIVELTSGRPTPGAVCMAFMEVVNHAGGLYRSKDVWKWLTEGDENRITDIVKLLVEILSQIEFPKDIEPESSNSPKKPAARKPRAKSKKKISQKK